MGRERALQAREDFEAKKKAQAEKNDEKTKMKGKNRPSRKYRKKKTNIIEEKKVKFWQSVTAEGFAYSDMPLGSLMQLWLLVLVDADTRLVCTHMH